MFYFVKMRFLQAMAEYPPIDISFIIPLSENTQHLRDALVSAVSHRLFTVEVVIVDDGPTHQNKEFEEQLIKEFPQVRWLRQEHSGPGAARNLGLAHARGEFISFLDSDDLVVSAAIFELLQIARAFSSDMVFGMPECFQGWRRWTPHFWKALSSLSAINCSCTDHPVSIRHNLAGGKLYRHEFIRTTQLTFPADVRRGEDWQFNATALRRSNKVSFTPRICYRYRKYSRRVSTLSTRVSADLLLDLLLVYERINYVWANKENPELRRHRDRHFLTSITYHLRRFLQSEAPSHEKLTLLAHIQVFAQSVSVEARRDLPSYERLAYELCKVGALLAGAFYLTGETPPAPAQLMTLPEVLGDPEALLAVRGIRLKRALNLRIIAASMHLFVKRSSYFARYIRFLSPLHRLKVLAAQLVATFTRAPSGNLWLFGERMGHGGDDTSYFFFRWMQDRSCSNPCYFIAARDRLARIPQELHKQILIQGSFRHYLQLYRASVTVFNFSGNDLAPDWRLLNVLRQPPTPKVRVFLNHGVTAIHRVSNHWQFQRMRARYDSHDICTVSSEVEKRIFVEELGHPSTNLRITGITRLDGLHGVKPSDGPKKNILYIPTWRPWLRSGTYQALIGSRFYAEVFQLLHDAALHSILSIGNASLTVLIHHVFHPFMKQLESLGGSTVQVLDMHSCDIQATLQESDLLITDYSSISFDFAYMNRPVIFYQFDQEHFFSARGGYFANPHDELPGRTVTNRAGLLEELERVIRTGWRVDPAFEKRVMRFFEHRDGNNCQRVYDAIVAALAAQSTHAKK